MNEQQKNIIQVNDKYGVSYYVNKSYSMSEIEEAFQKLYKMNEPINYDTTKNDNILLMQLHSIELLVSLENDALLLAKKIIKKLLDFKFVDDETRSFHQALYLQSISEYTKAHNIYLNLFKQSPSNRLYPFIIHMLEFNMGWTREMLGSSKIMVALNQNHKDYHYGYLKGIESFSLIENGLLEEGFEACKEALKINNQDVYAIHAGAHYYYEKGEFKEGIKWIKKYETGWVLNRGMKVHLWWHLAIFYLYEYNINNVIEILNKELSNDENNESLEDLDATSLLWRLFILDINIASYQFLNNWKDYVKKSMSTFNDMHAIMAYIMLNDYTKAKYLINEVEHRNKINLDNESIDLLKGLYYFGIEDYMKSSVYLKNIKNYKFGGSNAQKDVVNFTLFISLIRAKKYQEAKKILREYRGINFVSKLNKILNEKVGDDYKY